MAKYNVGDELFFVRLDNQEFKVSYGAIAAVPIGFGIHDFYRVTIAGSMISVKVRPQNLYPNYYGAHLVAEACNSRLKDAHKNIAEHYFAIC